MNVILILKKVAKRVDAYFNNVALKSLVTKESTSNFTASARVYNIAKERAKIKLSNFVTVEGELLVFAYGGQISIGDFSYVGIDSRIWSGNSITIGRNVLISHQCNIIDSNSHEMDMTEREEGYKRLIKEGHPRDVRSIITQPIVIEDNAWISFGSTILKGVTIGKGAVVAAGSVVTKNVPPFTVVAGNPAKVIKKLTENNSNAVD